MLGLPLGEPDVVAGHGPAVTSLEVPAGPVDQGSGVGELPLQGLLMGVVGDIDSASRVLYAGDPEALA